MSSCSYLYKIEKDKFGEPILNEKAKYTFNERLSNENSKKIDTIAYYMQIFEGQYYNESEMKNPRIIIFHNDGFFKRESLLYYGYHDKNRDKNSVYYGGKYKIVDYKIYLEKFYPLRGDYTKYYTKEISKGKIEGDKLIFEDKNSITIFQKRKTLLKNFR
ncbi:hypothetical protein [Kaistella flava (ex Peng et al. 2021)]|uniref:hypothetical protein n=1 Tax=Kaistella flava (ex Peng et al. 2021) TaxID=2038776 RepID=UPI001FC8E5DF|nr:hypothetical protein [Kaistella flava (ex Peng et al. 2021)]